MSTCATHRGIVVGVDGSPAATVAVDWAASDAALRDVPLTLVHVLTPPTVVTSVPRTATTWPAVPLPSGFKQWQQIQGRRILREAHEAVEDRARAARPSSVNTELLSGSTVPTLVDLSEEAEMIVVGCRGRGALRRRLLGSVSSGLVHHAHCPVAVIHDEDPLMPQPGARARRCRDRRFTRIGIGDGDRLRRSFAPKRGTRRLILFQRYRRVGFRLCRAVHDAIARRAGSGEASKAVAGALSRRQGPSRRCL